MLSPEWELTINYVDDVPADLLSKIEEMVRLIAVASTDDGVFLSGANIHMTEQLLQIGLYRFAALYSRTYAFPLDALGRILELTAKYLPALESEPEKSTAIRKIGKFLSVYRTW